jgi:hypothetical protein
MFPLAKIEGGKKMIEIFDLKNANRCFDKEFEYKKIFLDSRLSFSVSIWIRVIQYFHNISN